MNARAATFFACYQNVMARKQAIQMKTSRSDFYCAEIETKAGKRYVTPEDKNLLLAIKRVETLSSGNKVSPKWQHLINRINDYPNALPYFRHYEQLKSLQEKIFQCMHSKAPLSNRQDYKKISCNQSNLSGYVSSEEKCVLDMIAKVKKAADHGELKSSLIWKHTHDEIRQYLKNVAQHKLHLLLNPNPPGFFTRLFSCCNKKKTFSREQKELIIDLQDKIKQKKNNELQISEHQSWMIDELPDLQAALIHYHIVVIDKTERPSPIISLHRRK